VAQFEARLARCELAAARGEPQTAELAAHAAELATTGGHRASLARLTELHQVASTNAPAQRPDPEYSCAGQPTGGTSGGGVCQAAAKGA
ncbi:MAG: hypothetical protein M3235_09305, partial [Actinomycetota bacterium]|nr:hypothetical protein [Actinomycetota bacterium]